MTAIKQHPAPPPPLLVGLTGGIGSGKSTALKILQSMGATCIDADAIAHAITKKGSPALSEISAYFGKEMLNDEGELDRAKLRACVFNHAAKKQALQDITHPKIKQQIWEDVATATSQNAPVIILDIPLLVESGAWTAQLHHIVVLECSRATQHSRVSSRNKMSYDEIERIINSQASSSQRLACADFVINNDADLTSFKEKIIHLGTQLGLNLPI